MNNEMFERLLFEEEGTTIDFKKEQYRFIKASDEEKSELVKDLIGFANAWRRTTAYILVGVEEVRGGKSNVIGIPASDQLDDHSLQQFINHLVNSPIRFNYRAFCYEGKQVGIFVIEEGQERPIHLTKNYGKLERDKVYVRRGSSTDPSKPASPTEIAQMGKAKPRERADVVVEFAHVDRDDAIGASVHIECEFCSVPDAKDIPRLAAPSQGPFDLGPDLLRHNPNYFHELAEYKFMTRLCQPVRIVVKNVGEVAASKVRLELVVPMGCGLVPTEDLPPQPEKAEMPGSRVMREIRPVNRRSPGEVDIDKNEDRCRIVIDCKDLQPGRRVWSDKFYIGAGRTGDYPIHGHVFADQLPTPQEFTLMVAARVKQTTLTVQDICGKRVPAPK